MKFKQFLKHENLYHDLPIADSSNGALSELHNILSKGSSFVRKDKFYL